MPCLLAYTKNLLTFKIVCVAHIRTRIRARVSPDLILDEVLVLPDHDHAPCCHALQLA